MPNCCFIGYTVKNNSFHKKYYDYFTNGHYKSNFLYYLHKLAVMHLNKMVVFFFLIRLLERPLNDASLTDQNRNLKIFQNNFKET